MAGYIRQCQQLSSYSHDANVLVERSEYLIDDKSFPQAQLYRLVADDLGTVLALGIPGPSDMLLNTFNVARRIGKVVIHPENKALGS